METITSFEHLLGETLQKVVNVDGEMLVFVLQNGDKYALYHIQDCCESVTIEDICGDLEDLVGSPLLLAEEVVEDGGREGEYSDTSTWTFYKMSTTKGSVTIRWYGTSSGCYSESVDFDKAEECKHCGHYYIYNSYVTCPSCKKVL